jgi:hypothetical protein
MPENVEHQPWFDSPWVETMTDYEDNSLEEVIDLSKISWFDVKMDLADSDIEKKEKVAAMQEQIRLGILQPNGYPVGMQMPPGMRVEGIPAPHRGFNFPGAIGMPLPSKFNSTPVTRQLQASDKKIVPGILPALKIPQKGQDRTVFERGNENLRRIQELTRDRRK